MNHLALNNISKKEDNVDKACCHPFCCCHYHTALRGSLVVSPFKKIRVNWQHLHPDWTFPSMAVLHMTSPPRGRCHSSKHHWLM